jgi:hypothetical protein
MCHEDTHFFTSFIIISTFVTSLVHIYINKCKKRYRFKKATLYQREVVKKSKNPLFAGTSFHTHTTGG